MDIKPADNLILGLSEPVRREQANVSAKAAVPEADGLDKTFQVHIQKALSMAETTERVDLAQIRRELEAGVYDTPEMARAVAQKMFHLGI